MQVLVVDDEAPMRRVLQALLLSEGYAVTEAENGRDAIAQAGARNPDIVLLDLGLPDIDGIEVTRALRQFSRAAIIVLSARAGQLDKVDALDAGADDYLMKPYGVPELLARMRIARPHLEGRSDERAVPVFAVGPLRVDRESLQVRVDGREVHLTPTEYKLLTALIKKAGSVVTHRQLLKETWGVKLATQTQYLHVYMGNLRTKLEANPARPRLLLTEPGVGYRIISE